MRVVPAGAEQLKVLAALDKHSPGGGWNTTRFLQEQELAWSTTWVALDDNNVVAGFVIFWRVAGELEIHNVVTDPTRRRQGIGRTLIAAVLNYAKADQMTRVLLEVRERNTPARRLYQSVGFSETGRRPGYYPAYGSEPADNAVLMECTP